MKEMETRMLKKVADKNDYKQAGKAKTQKEYAEANRKAKNTSKQIGSTTCRQ